MPEFEQFVQEERIRISPIVASCNLTGNWGDFYGPSPFEFLVDGAPSTNGKCPNCQSTLVEADSIDSGDCNIEFWLYCNCGLIWYEGEERIV
jgi:hypothetical protein